MSGGAAGAGAGETVGSGPIVTGPIVTGLYVPGDRPERFDKAVATGAHLVILDLEDAVAEAQREFARESVATWLRAGEHGSTVIQVRVNAGEPRDLEVLAAVDARFEIRVPKVESLDDVEAVASVVSGHPITALFETARGIENAAVVAAHPAVTRLALGESDLASDLGTSAPEAMDYARVRVLFAARSAGLAAPMLSAYPRIRDLEGLRRDTERGRDLGWVGRNAVHPSQLAVIAGVFRPGADQLDWARDVLAAITAGGVTTLANGDMVDGAMLGRAEKIVTLARALERS
ncbi:MAG: CoA ester lyase [Microbacteriaceae bacterium]|nr:CoA ester lyase [Microbacteriaceae bacterium]